MKLRHLSLGVAILVSAACVAGVGVYLKYDILKPYDLYQDKSVFELPFLIHSDEALKYMLEEIMSTSSDTEPGDTYPTVSTPSETQQTDTAPKPTTWPTSGSTVPGTDPFNGALPTTAPTQTKPTTPPPTTTVPPTTKPPATTQPTEPNLPSGYPDFYFPEGVEESWFDDVLFIGDSRTYGLKSWARSGNADYFCDVGASVFNIQKKELSDINFSTQTLASLLSTKTYGKIFINLGLNEIGYPTSSVTSAYKRLVTLVREKQPDAIIILQGIMSVTPGKASQATYFSPQSIANLNSKIAANANGKDIFYVDCNEYLADSDGYLYTSLTNDGYHPTGNGYRIWRSWIHWVVGELDI